jgi:nicotinamidase/pyrazinamidase
MKLSIHPGVVARRSARARAQPTRGGAVFPAPPTDGEERRGIGMKRIYIDVDTQFDFCDPTGALFVQGAPAAAAVCARLVRHAAARGELILGSVDSHTHEAWEFATNANRGPAGEKPNFPPHCVKGTRGWLKLPDTLPARFSFVPVDAAQPTVAPHSQAVYFEKEVYSLFANPNAAKLLDAHVASEPVEFVVFGVATDYCVRAAALGLLEWARTHGGAVAGSRVTVVEDAVAGVAPESTARAVAEMRTAGVRFAPSAEVLAAR